MRFKVGDKVRCIGKDYEPNVIKDRIYTIKEVDGDWIGIVCNYTHDKEISKGKANWYYGIFKKIKPKNIPREDI